jgi:hypothetical protein
MHMPKWQMVENNILVRKQQHNKRAKKDKKISQFNLIDEFYSFTSLLLY